MIVTYKGKQIAILDSLPLDDKICTYLLAIVNYNTPFLENWVKKDIVHVMYVNLSSEEFHKLAARFKRK